MVNIMKRILAVVLFATLLSGCASVSRNARPVIRGFSDFNVSTDVALKPTIKGFSDDSYQVRSYKGEITDVSKGARKLDDKFQKVVNEIGADLCLYLNTEFNADWEYSPIDAYASEVTDQMKGMLITYGACYYNGAIYVDQSLISDEIDAQFKYVVGHELIHYLYEINCGQEHFALNRKGNHYFGLMFEEGIIDYLSIQYARKNNPGTEFYGGYKNSRLCISLLSLDLPEISKFFLKGDIKGFEKLFNEHAEKHLVCEGNVFKKFISMIDEIQIGKDLSINMSRVITFIAFTTSSEKSDEFLSRAKEEGYENWDEFVSIMY